MSQACVTESLMRFFTISLLTIAITRSAWSQQQVDSSRLNTETPAVQSAADLDTERLGMGDVVAVTVYDSPELSRSVHVGVDGTIRLPMVRQHILAAGQTPDELENNIAAALVDEHLMVGPIVSVSLVETHSRPITVIGAVRTPITFEVSGTVTLLEAIVKAGGLTENAGTEILVSHPSTDAGGSGALFTERIPLHAAMDISDPASRLKLEGGKMSGCPTRGGFLWLATSSIQARS